MVAKLTSQGNEGMSGNVGEGRSVESTLIILKLQRLRPMSIDMSIVKKGKFMT